MGPGCGGSGGWGSESFGLEKEEIINAMGLPISGADIQRVNYGYDGHFFESAMQAMHGIIAAENGPEWFNRQFRSTKVPYSKVWRKLLSDPKRCWQIWVPDGSAKTSGLRNILPALGSIAQLT